MTNKKGAAEALSVQPWTHIGGDLEARYDGRRFVDIRVRGTTAHFFVSKGALEAALKLMDPPPVHR